MRKQQQTHTGLQQQKTGCKNNQNRVCHTQTVKWAEGHKFVINISLITEKKAFCTIKLVCGRRNIRGYPHFIQRKIIMRTAGKMLGSKVGGKYLIKIGKLIQLSINFKEISYTLVHINLEKLHHINIGMVTSNFGGVQEELSLAHQARDHHHHNTP